MTESMHCVVMGASAGGIQALSNVFRCLPSDFFAPIAVVQHIAPNSGRDLVKVLALTCPLPVAFATDKEPLRASTIYVAPPNYHMLIERDRTIALNVDERVNYVRPSADLLFITAATTFGPNTTGVVLSGGNSDGSEGLERIAMMGGDAIVQDPKTAQAQSMPQKAIDRCPAAKVCTISQIAQRLTTLSRGRK